MFTGIIETLGEVVKLEKDQSNLHITIQTELSAELQIDQSVAHNGVCLTVVALTDKTFTTTAIAETMEVTNLGSLEVGKKVNLERCMQMNGRLDGHIVQGHVDQVGVCKLVEENDGSWRYVVNYKANKQNVIVEKGSICINGISLTAFNVTNDSFEVAIIPYTHEHTNLHQVAVGDAVNLEFDIIGKYIARLQQID